MVMAAMIEAGHEYLWLMLLFASAGVFHHAGIKIPFFAFFAHDSGLRPKEAPTNMLVAMGIAAFMCILVGSYPEFLYQLLPWENDYVAYDLTHTLTQLQLLFFSALAFVWLNKKGLYPPELKSVNLDFEWIYRKVMPATGSSLMKIAGNINTSLIRFTMGALNALPATKFGTDANATTMTLRMAVGFVVLAILAFASQFI
jgi:multicomponent Na+:H+ antiporter subunit D